jgi:hypothetical protein
VEVSAERRPPSEEEGGIYTERAIAETATTTSDALEGRARTSPKFEFGPPERTMLGGEDAYMRPKRRRFLGNISRRPRVLAGSVAGTLAFYVFFLYTYTREKDDSVTKEWWGIRSDGRCGPSFATEWNKSPLCGKGECCSSHGWCGRGEEYCSKTQGCVSGCWDRDMEEENRENREELAHHHDEEHHGHEDGHAGHAPDDDEYIDRMHNYGYGDHHMPWNDRHGYHGRRGHDYHTGGNHDDDWDHYHHRYDEDPDRGWDSHDEFRRHGDVPYGDDHAAHEERELEHEGGHHGDGRHDDEYGDEYSHGGRGHGEGGGPELVGLSEKRHLGAGDHVPLEGHPEEQAA